jgi:hypothetical protein
VWTWDAQQHLLSAHPLVADVPLSPPLTRRSPELLIASAPTDAKVSPFAPAIVSPVRSTATHGPAAGPAKTGYIHRGWDTSQCIAEGDMVTVSGCYHSR